MFTGVGDVLRHLALPAGVVCVSGLGELVKQTRSACLESLGEDYILTARAKGLGERPFIPLWFGRTLHVQSPTVDGIDYPSSAFSNENVWDWVYRG